MNPGRNPNSNFQNYKSNSPRNQHTRKKQRQWNLKFYHDQLSVDTPHHANRVDLQPLELSLNKNHLVPVIIADKCCLVRIKVQKQLRLKQTNTNRPYFLNLENKFSEYL